MQAANGVICVWDINWWPRKKKKRSEKKSGAMIKMMMQYSSACIKPAPTIFWNMERY